MTALPPDERHDDTALHLLRELAPQVLGVLARRFGEWEAAEDAVQEAVIAAAEQWPAAGVPTNPKGWLYQVATRRMHDHARSESARRRREQAVALAHEAERPWAPPPDDEVGVERDDALVLLFMCCHPALTPSSAIALTLRAVGGLTTAEIASAFLVPEATMAQRISRAKATVKASGVPFAMPSAEERGERLRSVLHVLYLVFNEGYVASSGSAVHRVELAAEAIRLTRMLRALVEETSPGSAESSEVAGLLALMLLTDARRAARTGPDGELIPLDEQDRARWDRALVDEGVAMVSGAMARGAVGPYQLQAAIAALHDSASSVAETDWAQVLLLYELLERMTPDNPMVALNRVVAAAMVEGAAAGLAMLEVLGRDARVAGHYRLDAVRAHLLEMDGRSAEARVAYLAAAEGTNSIAERDYLVGKAGRVGAG